MKFLKLVLLSCLSLCMNQMQAMEHEIDVKKVDTKSAAAKKAEKDAAKKAQVEASKAKADKMVSDVYKENESSPLVKTDEKAPESGSFNLTESLLDQDKIQADKDIEANKFNSGKDFLKYVWYKLQQFGDMFPPSSLPEDVTTELNKIPDINRRLEQAQIDIEALKQKYIKLYNPDALNNTHGYYDDGKFQKDVKTIIDPIVADTQTIIQNISKALKNNYIGIDRTSVQNSLKDFNKDLNQAITTEYKGKLKKKRSELPSRPGKDKTPTLFSKDQ